jgi:intracellular sulfur oxidation DsrE/DsrF family protein
MKLRAVPCAVLLAAALCAASAAARAQPDDGVQESPFVAHRLALQLSDRAPDKQALVLSVANEMLKQYGMDKIAIDVVAFGPGIDLLRADSPNRARVDSLDSAGVRFDICMNTVETVERETGKPVPINPRAHKVAAAVARILFLTEHGYTLVRP